LGLIFASNEHTGKKIPKPMICPTNPLTESGLEKLKTSKLYQIKQKLGSRQMRKTFCSV